MRHLRLVHRELTAEECKLVLSQWEPKMEQLFRAAEATPPDAWSQDYIKQAKLIHTIGVCWEAMPDEKRQSAQARALRYVPMLTANPRAFEVFMDMIVQRWSSRPYEDIARALQVGLFKEQDFVALDEEKPYLEVGGWLGDYVDWAKAGECPIAFHFWAAVALIGAVAKFRVSIDRRAYRLRLNHYVFLFGPQGTGKGQAKSAMLDILRRLNRIIDPEHPEDAHHARIRLIPEDTNQSAMLRLLKPEPAHSAKVGSLESAMVDSTGFLVLDELATFFSKDAFRISKTLPFLVTAYSEEEYDYYTVTGGHIHLENLALSMLGCSTLDWIKDAITPLLMHGGFLDRTQLIYRTETPRVYSTPGFLDPVRAIQLAHGLLELATLEEPVLMAGDLGALEWYDDWYRKIPVTDHIEMARPGQEGDSFSTSSKRQANHLWKLAAILSISEGTHYPWITRAHMEKAAKLLKLEREHSASFFQMVSRSPEGAILERLLQVLWRIGKGDAVRWADLISRVKAWKGLRGRSRLLLEYLYTMQDAGMVKLVKMVGKTGQPTRGFAIRPLVEPRVQLELPATPDPALLPDEGPEVVQATGGPMESEAKRRRRREWPDPQDPDLDEGT